MPELAASFRRAFTPVVAFAVAMALLAAPLAATTTAPGAETPEALVARMTAAAEAGDVREAVACLAPDDRAEMALGLLVATTMMVAFMEMGTEMAGAMAGGMAEAVSGEKLDTDAAAELAAGTKKAKASGAAMQARLEEILERHGVDRLMEGEPLDLEGDPAAARKALAGIDDVALVGDLVGLLESLGEGEGGALSESLPVGPIEVLTVDGDRGTARAGDQPLDLVRVDGRWYFEAPEEAAAEAEPPAAE